MAKKTRCIRWLLGDQLNEHHSWFAEIDDEVLYVIAELRQETVYVRHHIQKLCAFFAAMAQFAARLEERGHRVLHLDLDASADHDSLPGLIDSVCRRYGAQEFAYQRPDEYRLLTELRGLDLGGDAVVEECDSEHFLLPFAGIETQFEAGKRHRMESFYRMMRRRFDILMEGDEPLGGRWNFDKENRNKLKQDDLDEIPEPLLFGSDVSAIVERLDRHDVQYFGEVADPLPWPVNRDDALKLLRYFCRHGLPRFGRFQDAMTGRSEVAWSLYHSRLSFALNSKLLHPREVIDAACAAYHGNDRVDLAQVEGFVRQVLGWREFVRGIYWANMPAYAESNHYQAKRDLPGFFWSGETRMHCLQQAIGQSLEYAYAHHIQRLMVTGNFCLLAGVDPDQVDHWYLGIYIDAIEWVEMPNTRGMALFADGGVVGSKPYAAGGNYINKMSDYCGDCHYDVKEKTGPRACPLNSLYWHFMNRNREELQHNHRLRMIYGSWDRMAEKTRRDILARAETHLSQLDHL